MFVKEYNSNRYIFLNYDDFACKRNYFDEMIRIQYNKVYTYPNELEELERILNQSKKQINKQYQKRE
jgi:hypothetical protein